MQVIPAHKARIEEKEMERGGRIDTQDPPMLSQILTTSFALQAAISFCTSCTCKNNQKIK
jgi:hypothetical protein